MDVTIAGWVYLPVSELTELNINNMKQDLTVYPRRTTDIATKEDPAPLFLFDDDEEGGRFGVPRNYYLRTRTRVHNEILNVSRGNPMSNFESLIRMEGPYAEQSTAVRVMLDALDGKDWGGVVLEAACGAGKTTVGLEFAKRIGLSTVILVHKDFLADQWVDRIREFMPGAMVGRIKQKTCDFEGKDFVVASMQSLARETGSRYPREIYESAFGTLIVDELHRVGSDSWSKLAPMFNCAYRCGLSATLRRADGCEQVFWDHISETTYRAETQTLVPAVRRLTSSFRLSDIHRGSYHVKAENMNSAQVLTQLGDDLMRCKAINDQVVSAASNGRKILVISERLDQLRTLSKMFERSMKGLGIEPSYDFYVGEWFSGEVYETFSGRHRKGDPKMVKRTKDDLRKAESAQVIYATKQLVNEGMDITALDVLIFATPMGDIEQAVGRIRRWCFPSVEKCQRLCPWRAGDCSEKPKPVVVDVMDVNVPQLHGKIKRREFFYKQTGGAK